jgi:hypothetical protein
MLSAPLPCRLKPLLLLLLLLLLVLLLLLAAGLPHRE